MRGEAGLTGAQGPTTAGPTGPTGERGPVASNFGVWSGFWDYTFNGNSNDILHFDRRMAGDISNYLNENPTRRLGIDGADAQRVEVVRQALLNAGVPAWKTQVGPYGDPQLRRYGRVAVLVN